MFEPFGSFTTTRPVPQPPPSFRPVFEPIDCAAIVRAETPRGKGDTAAKASGIRYEGQVAEYIRSLRPEARISPTVRFTDACGSERICIPDAVIEVPRGVVVVEVKLQHMPEAWWQLEQLYRPVLRLLYPKQHIFSLEICRSYDPAMPFPVDVELVTSLEAYLDRPLPRFCVHWWKK